MGTATNRILLFRPACEPLAHASGHSLWFFVLARRRDAVDESKRLMITGWIDKASNHLDVAQEYLKSRCRASDAIQESQVCVELSVKSVLTILGIDFPKTHGWGEKELRKIAEDIQNRRLLVRLKDQSFHIRLPRLLILVNFWEQFYIQAKYGIEAGNLAPA